MRGRPNLDLLAFLVGRELCFVAAGMHDLQLGFEHGGHFSITGKISIGGSSIGLVTAAKVLLDQLGQTITKLSIGDPEDLIIDFSSGIKLVLHPDPIYESYVIDGPDGKIAYIMQGL
jgi:hypothetical protein